MTSSYDYAQLEGLWIQAGGPAAQAPVAAAIAEAESGGNPLAAYPGTTVAPGQGSTDDATGLWQILGLPAGDFTAAELTDPLENAEMAVAKYTQAGDWFSPWETYDTGAYAQYVQSGTSPQDVTGAQLLSYPGQGLVQRIENDTVGKADSNIVEAFGLIWDDFKLWAASAAVVAAGSVLVLWGIGRATGAGRKAENLIVDTAGAAGAAAVAA